MVAASEIATVVAGRLMPVGDLRRTWLQPLDSSSSGLTRGAIAPYAPNFAIGQSPDLRSFTAPSPCVPGRSRRRSCVVERRAGVACVEMEQGRADGGFGRTYWIYIMANEPHGVLYVGMTSDLARRALEHRAGVLEGFTKRYGVDRLVYFEAHDDAAVAARRERAMKRWRRDWKIELIERGNPTWRDLFEDVVRNDGYEP